MLLGDRDNSENTSNWRDDPPTTGRENRNAYSRVVRASFVSSASSCGPTMSGSWWIPSKCRSVTRKFSPVFKSRMVKLMHTTTSTVKSIRVFSAPSYVATFASSVSNSALWTLTWHVTDPQGAGHSHSGVSQWPDTDLRTDSDSALIWRSTAGRPTDTHRTGSTRFLCRSPIHLELFTCWHSTVRERSLI